MEADANKSSWLTRKTLILPVLLCALLWGSAFPAIKGIYASWATDGIEPTFSHRLLLAGVRFAVAGLALLLLAKQPWKEFKATPLKLIILLALFQTFFQYMMFYSALATSGAVLGSLLACAGSFWWVLLAPVLIKTAWPTPKQWGLLTLGAVGVLVAVYRPGAGSGNPVLGATLFLASSFFGTLGVLLMPKLKSTMGARASTGFGLLIGGLMLCLVGFPSWSVFAQLFTPVVWVYNAYLAFVSAAAFAIWNHLATLFPVNLLAGYRFLIPICAIIESVIFVKTESLSAGIVTGGLIVLTAVIGLQRTRH